VAGQAADAGHARQRAVLAVLLLDMGHVVMAETLIDRVWGEAPPVSVRNALYGYVAKLRAVIADLADPEVTLYRRQGGYLLRAQADQLDLHRFRRLVTEASSASDEDKRAAGLLREALGLWRGPALAGLDSPWLNAMRDTFELEREAVVLDLNDIRLRQGEHRALVSELVGQAAARPADERLIGQLMLALYRSGRQTEALRWFEQTRQQLADELGTDPGPGLRALHQQILRADPSLTVPEDASRPTAAPGAELRELHRHKPIADPGLYSPDPEPPAVVCAAGGTFVGRLEELTALNAAATAARAGHPAVVLVEGEAGIGKTTLLSRFVSGLTDAMVLRASGDETERLLPYGIVDQLTGSAGDDDDLPGLLATDLNDGVDPLAVGADLVAWLGRMSASHEMVLGIIDDLQWADGPSARALLFAARRLRTARVLIVVSARSAELVRLGQGWERFLAGDHRVIRVRLGAFTQAEVAQLGRALGRGELPRPVVRRLIAETGGHPLYCRAVLEEAKAADQLGESPRVPRSLAGVVLGKVSALSPAARELVTAAAVLGSRCRLPVVARLAELADPVPALDEAVAAGIVAEQPDAAGMGVAFTHLLVQRAVYGDLSPRRRRGLHRLAAGLVDQGAVLGHRVAAAAGRDDDLAAELEAAAHEARRFGRLAQAAAWLAQAAEMSTSQEATDRRFLDALETLVSFGELADAKILVAKIGTVRPSARRSWLLGSLDFFTGQVVTAEARLIDAWHTHERDRDAAVGCAAATRLTILCMFDGRIGEAIEWGERAVATAPATASHRTALGVLGISLCFAGRMDEAASRLAVFDDAPAEVAPEATDALVLRGIVRSLTDDLPGAAADLSFAVGRLRAGVPLRSASWCLLFMAGAEYLSGAWDDAVLNAEMAVSLASDADRTWELSFAHGIAAIVPAHRGEWDTAAAHVRLAQEAGHVAGSTGAIAGATIAQEYLAMSQGDLEGVLVAAATTRANINSQFLSLAVSYDWRFLELEALIHLGRLGRAEIALAELEADLPLYGPATARATAARLRAELALAAGDPAAAAAAMEDALQHARDLQAPLLAAQLEITDARRLRGAGQPAAAVARLTSARQRLSRLRAIPHLLACDRELAAAKAAALPPGPHAKEAIDV
jgi:DNA-binding SARP family transcriptional activator